MSRTALYLHDGRLATLAEVLDRYDRGDLPGRKPLGLSATENRQVLAFLDSLSSEPTAVPELPDYAL